MGGRFDGTGADLAWLCQAAARHCVKQVLADGGASASSATAIAPEHFDKVLREWSERSAPERNVPELAETRKGLVKE